MPVDNYLSRTEMKLLNKTRSPTNPLDVLEFHFKGKETRPFFYKCAKLISIGQPSSAAAERFFSLYRLTFGPQQGQMSNEKKVLTMFLRYNDQQRMKESKIEIEWGN